jgi:uncharacterized damage-inducible protein DinB
MLRRHLFATAVILSCTIASAAPLASQSGAQVDPLSGLWGRKDGAGLDLTFDGRSAVTGTIYVTNSGPATISSGSFDPRTRVLKLAGTATGSDGQSGTFAIEGTLEGDTLQLRYSFGQNQGEATLTRAGAEPAVQPGVSDPSPALRKSFGDVSGWVTTAADMVPADKYAYRPASTVRTFGQLVAHIADAYHYSCSRAAGRAVDWAPAIENGPADKATIVAKLKEATDACAAVHAAGGSVDALVENVGHTNLHYGNIATYMRMLGLVPPSS